jgi:hypothetical protein
MVWLFECLVCVKLKCRYAPEVGFGIYGPKRVLGADNGRGKSVLYYNYLLDSRLITLPLTVNQVAVMTGSIFIRIFRIQLENRKLCCMYNKLSNQ